MIGKQSTIILCTGFALAFAPSGWAEKTEYTLERYDVIIERSPFGEDPLAPELVARQEAAAALAAAKALAKELRLCFLLEGESGEIRAGFQNLTAKPGDPRSVMLMVGDNFRGMKLTNIDLLNSSATLLHMGKPVTFELTKAPASARQGPPKAAPKKPERRFGGGFRRKPPKPVKPPEPQLSPEEEAVRREEVRENLRQYQMEVIREGMPPLPIPLTQEMDDQLVSEGVLPAMDEE